MLEKQQDIHEKLQNFVSFLLHLLKDVKRTHIQISSVTVTKRRQFGIYGNKHCYQALKFESVKAIQWLNESDSSLFSGN